MTEPDEGRRLTQTFGRHLAAVTALGFLLRLGLVFWVPTQPTSDFWGYYHRGLNLAERGTYQAISGKIDATHPPLYPILLAGAFLLVPAHTLGAAKLVNCLLAGIAIVVVALFTRRLWGNRAGLLAALILAVLPRSLLMPCLIASENLFSPLLLLFTWIVVEGADSRRATRLAAAAGFVLALTTLTRTVAYYLWALWPLAALAGRRRLRVAIGQTLLLLAVQHIVMLPWALRNQAQLGRFTFLNTAGGYGLFLGNNPNAIGLWYDGRADLEKVAPGVLAKGDLAVSDAANAAAWRWIRQNPGPAFALYLKKLRIIFEQTFIIASFAVSGRNVVPPWPGQDVLPWPHFLKDHPYLLTRTLWATGWLLVILGSLGCLLLFRRWFLTRAPHDLSVAVAIPAAALYVPLVSALIAVNGRYRWPVEDILIPVAAIAVSDALRRFIKRRRPSE